MRVIFDIHVAFYLTENNFHNHNNQNHPPRPVAPACFVLDLADGEAAPADEGSLPLGVHVPARPEEQKGRGDSPCCGVYGLGAGYGPGHGPANTVEQAPDLAGCRAAAS